MNLNMHEASLYLHKLARMVKVHRNVEVVIAPSIFTIQSLSLQIDFKQFKIAAQNFYWRDHGPFTGEVSASQLRGIVQYGIIGHSERRYIFNETEKDIRNKVAAAVRNEIKPILCIGETAWERSNNETFDIIRDQLTSGLANITSDELDQIIIAYEPVWSVGTGKNAMPDDVISAVKYIRRHVEHLYGAQAASNIKVLYGGSVTATSAADYLAIEGIDGLLVGMASLEPNTFNEIIEKAHSSAKAVIKK